MVTASTGTYTVLARRFRPQGFADVVGQGHVAQALRNAIQSNRVAHAYLFTGARGVGKTSTARILAKALNCPNAVDGNPCNDCEICDGIAAGNDVDVLEIDGASNRGIDDIRQLRANVNVKSMRTKFKLYIIDEVHMLTKEAFNALLKTLEEPPPNVKFVFCTTEPNKLPDTILSRCQRFDFGTIGTSNIRGRLAQIADAEGVQVDEDALELVARRAAGSMRDSQSIFDQLLAFGEAHITAQDVHRLLGTASDDRLITIVSALVEGNQAAAITELHQALEGGVQLGELTDQILFYLRDLMVLASGATGIALSSVGPGNRETLASQANQWGLQTIIAAMQILADTKGRMQRVTYGQALAELALVRIALLEDFRPVDGVIDRLRQAETSSAPAGAPEKKNDGTSLNSAHGPAHAAGPPTGSAAAAASVPPSVTDRTDCAHGDSSLSTSVTEPSGGRGTSDRHGTTTTEPQPAAGPQNTDGMSDRVGSPPAQTSRPDQVLERDPLTAVSQVAGDVIASPQPQDTPLEAATQARDGADIRPGGLNGTQTLPAVRTESHATAESATVAVARQNSPTHREPADSGASQQVAPDPAPESGTIVSGRVSVNPEDAGQIWTQMLEEINDLLRSHVKQVSKAAISAPNKLELTFPRKYHFSKRYCEKPEVISRLEQIAERISGQNLRVSLVVSEDDEAAPDSQTAEAGRPPAVQTQRTYRPEDDEFVATVMTAFDAECVRVDSQRIGTSETDL